MTKTEGGSSLKNKIIIPTLLILGSFFLIQTANADITFSDTLTPSHDCYIDNSDGTPYNNWYNTSNQLYFDDTGDDDDNQYPEIVTILQFNTSTIPDSSTITEASLRYYITQSQTDQAYGVINRMEDYTLTDGSNATQLFTDAKGGRYYERSEAVTYSTGWITMNTSAGRMDGSSSPGSYSDEDIRTNIQENLTNDYFCVAFFLQSKYDDSLTASMYSKDYSMDYAPQMWYSATLNNCTYVNNTYPVDGASDVNHVPYPTGAVIQSDLYHTNGHTIYATAWLYNPVTSSWMNESYTTGTNKTWLTSMPHASDYGTTYEWYIETHDIYGHWYNSSVMSFTVEDLDPPTNITCNRNSSTSLNITFTPDTNADWTTIIYEADGMPTELFNDGSLNTTLDKDGVGYGILEGLTADTCYGLRLRSVYNNTGNSSVSAWANKDYGDCCLWSNYTNLFIRYENSSSDSENHLIDLSTVSPCANHILTIVYTNLTREEYIINATNYATYPMVIDLHGNPLYYILEWNASTINDTCSCSDLSPNYKRSLIHSSQNLTFYMITDRDVYADYNCTGSQISSFKKGTKNNLARYDYQVTDDSGIFSLYTDFNSYISFESSNETINHTIHQEFLFDDLIIDDVVLLYDKLYYVSAYNEYVNPSDYRAIDEAKTDSYVSPNTNPIVIPYRELSLDTYNDNWDITVSYSPGGSGMYVDFTEHTTNQITRIYVEIYDLSDGSLDYSSAVNTNNNNFSFAGASHSKEYAVYINLTHKDYARVASIVVWISPTTEEIVTHDYIETIFENIFGELPGNLDDPSETISWINVIIFFIALIPLSLLGVYNPGFASIGVGIWLLGANYMFAITALYGVAIFLILMGIIYIFGGRRT